MCNKKTILMISATLILSGCTAGTIQKPTDGTSSRAVLQHDLYFGDMRYMKGTAYPLYKSETEQVVFLQTSYNHLSYGIVLDSSGCHHFDGKNGFRSQSSGLLGMGYIKDSCAPFCADIQPKNICFKIEQN